MSNETRRRLLGIGIFLVLFDVVLTFPKDQVLMQRTLATKSDRDAGRSIWIFAAITILITLTASARQ